MVSSFTARAHRALALGLPLPVVSGGADGDDKDDPAVDDKDDGKDDDKNDPAVDDKDADAEKWKSLSRKNEKQLRETQKELDKLRNASKSEQEKAIDDAKKTTRDETLAEVRLERARDKVEAKAAGKVTDPEDVPALLGDLSRFVDDDGTIDNKAISAAIDELVKKKPYLAPGGKPSALPGGGRKGSEGTSMSDLIRRAAGR